MSHQEFDNISFDLPKNQSNVIKVIGVGGGGSNAINHMFSQGIKGVDFVICNTDAQALENSAVPVKIQLGVSLTEGLGAGANPKIGEQSAVESVEEIRGMLSTNTKMIFITAGMGGGTGTGAAPIIAKMAREFLDLRRRFRLLQSLRVGVRNNELHTLKFFFDHVIDRIAACTANAKYGNPGLELFLPGHGKVQCHTLSACMFWGPSQTGHSSTD